MAFLFLIPHCLCTDVGGIPTTSLFCETARFLKVHAGSSVAATPEEALRLVTVEPARILALADRLGRFAPGMEWSVIKVAADLAAWSGEDDPRAAAVKPLQRQGLDWGVDLQSLDADVRVTAARLEHRVRLVTRAGRTLWESPRVRSHLRPP